MPLSSDELQGLDTQSFDTKEDVFAVILPDQKKLGRIKEISSNGIIFQYFHDRPDEDEPEKALSADDYKVDIFIRQNGYFMRNLPIHHVYETTAANAPSFCRLPMRMVKIRFAELDPSQKEKLTYLATRYSFDM
ncbi:MAG: hypothetical protein KKF30_17695 [Proteobacteria bacterium]|nr:hypothetical protein [Pseudomonadota bacterium]MBU4469215.1 hypothetical protein [Pseudomonadota bacterium]MCG2752246.1 hypothetical protein [Desulfobacteraceae bacterium]